MDLNRIFVKDKSLKKDDVNIYLHLIAHEIRSPLVSIQGYTSLLREKYLENLPPDGRDYLLRIASNLERAETLLSDITQLARVAIVESNFKKVAVRDLIDTALEPHWFRIKKLNLKIHVADDMPELYCDESAMNIVFSNLIGNAVKYSRDNVAGNIDIGYIGDEIFHKFFIKDEGVGFKASDRNKVFLLFNRLRNKKNVSGSGLGLSIVKQIIEGHGGEIWVESRKNRGSKFYFTLPKNSPA